MWLKRKLGTSEQVFQSKYLKGKTVQKSGLKKVTIKFTVKKWQLPLNKLKVLNINQNLLSKYRNNYKNRTELEGAEHLTINEEKYIDYIQKKKEMDNIWP